MYSVEELLNILNEPHLPPENKKPFARFLVWVYMNTGGDKNQSGASELAKSKWVVCITGLQVYMNLLYLHKNFIHDFLTIFVLE